MYKCKPMTINTLINYLLMGILSRETSDFCLGGGHKINRILFVDL